MLTPDERRKYTKTGFNRCPICKGTKIHTSPPQADANQMWQDITCVECHCNYTDIYTLSDVEVHSTFTPQSQEKPKE